MNKLYYPVLIQHLKGGFGYLSLTIAVGDDDETSGSMPLLGRVSRIYLVSLSKAQLFQTFQYFVIKAQSKNYCNYSALN